MERRRFLKVLGVTGGGAALLSGCGIGPEPTEKLIPYLIPPEDQIPGTSTYYATTCRECPAGCGLHAKVREGRVVKLEGNPESPINHGRLCARGQAGLQGLYNPDRVTGPLERTGDGQWKPIAWDDAIGRLAARLKGARGKGIVFVTGHESGAFGELVDEWMRQVGGRHVTDEPFAFEALREGNGFARAHGFQAGRDASMAKFVFVGPRLSLTGMNADEWIAAAPATEGLLALAMASVIVRERLAPVPSDAVRLASLLSRHAPAQVASAVGIEPSVIARLARQVAASQGGLAVAGGIAAPEPDGAALLAAANILNYVAGTVGKTVKFGPNDSLGGAGAGSFQQMADLVSDMEAGKVAVLLVPGANPAHSLPGAVSPAIAEVGFKVGFSAYLDAQAAAADLILPAL